PLFGRHPGREGRAARVANARPGFDFGATGRACDGRSAVTAEPARGGLATAGTLDGLGIHSRNLPYDDHRIVGDRHE
ncbi:MAG: hypothetical protein V3T19_07480, partial [Acidiferrobacterales bacterium]